MTGKPRDPSRVLKAARVVAEIEELVRAAGLTDGHTLPSMRCLAERFRVSQETIRRAVRILADRGLLETVHGSGTVVTGGQGRLDAGRRAPRREHLAALHVRAPCLLTVATCEYTLDKKRLWAQVGRAFRARQPAVSIRLTPLTAPSVAPSTLAEADIIHFTLADLVQLGRQGQLLNLHAVVDPAGALAADVVPGLKDLFMANPCWAAPVAFDVEVVCVNRTRIPPASRAALYRRWDLRGMAEWAVDFGARYGMRQPVWSPRLDLLLSACGVDMSASLATPPARRNLLRALDELRDCHAIYPLLHGDLPPDATLGAVQRFVSQRSVVVFQHTFMLPHMRRKVPFDWEVRPAPLPPGAMPACLVLGCGISRNCHFPEEAVEFVRFLCGPEGQAIFAADKDNVPASLSAIRSEAFRQPPPLGMETVAAQLAAVSPWNAEPASPMPATVSRIWEQELTAFLAGCQTTQATMERVAERCETVRRMLS